MHAVSQFLAFRAQTTATTLQTAAFELKDEAFAPFWDAIEQAAGMLGECHLSSEWLAINVPAYDKILQGRQHNLPDCLEGIDDLPDCRPLLSGFYDLVRQAQRTSGSPTSGSSARPGRSSSPGSRPSARPSRASRPP